MRHHPIGDRYDNPYLRMAHCGRVYSVTGRSPPRNAATSLAERTVQKGQFAVLRCGAAHRAAPDLRQMRTTFTARYRVDFINNYLSTPRSVSRAREVSIR